MNVYQQSLIDRTMIELDATPNKSNLGTNAILGISMAVARAAAVAVGIIHTAEPSDNIVTTYRKHVHALMRKTPSEAKLFPVDF